MIDFKLRKFSFFTIVFTLLFTVGAMPFFFTAANGRHISNDSLSRKMLDSLWRISGKIVDSFTTEPIPFATITFYNGDLSSLAVSANEKGEFTTNIKNRKLKVQLSAIGYQERITYVASGLDNLLRLVPVNNALPDVVVSSKARKIIDARKIIKKVNKSIEQNYGNFSFDQKFRVQLVSLNYDTIKGESVDQILVHFTNEEKAMTYRSWQRDTIKYEESFFKFIGLPKLITGVVMPYADLIRKELVTGKEQLKKFEFKLLGQYQDSIHGSVISISFKPIDTYNDFFQIGRAASLPPLGYLKGEMRIRKEDYAVVHLKYLFEMNTANMNQSVEKDYLSPYWKGFSLSKVISSSLIYKYEYIYGKDAFTGKYHVTTIKADCYNTGYQIENHRKVQLYYKMNADNLGIINAEQ